MALIDGSSTARLVLRLPTIFRHPDAWRKPSTSALELLRTYQRLARHRKYAQHVRRRVVMSVTPSAGERPSASPRRPRRVPAQTPSDFDLFCISAHRAPYSEHGFSRNFASALNDGSPSTRSAAEAVHLLSIRAHGRPTTAIGLPAVPSEATGQSCLCLFSARRLPSHSLWPGRLHHPGSMRRCLRRASRSTRRPALLWRPAASPQSAR